MPTGLQILTGFQSKKCNYPHLFSDQTSEIYTLHYQIRAQKQKLFPPPPPAPLGLNPTKFDSSRLERTTYTCCRIVIKTSGITFIPGGKVFISVVSDVSNNSGRPLTKNKNVLEISSNILTMKPSSKLSVA